MTKKPVTTFFLLFTLLIITSTLVPEAYGQNKPLIKAQVVQISGQIFYLDAGQTQGLAEGDTLSVFENDQSKSVRGRLVVIASSSSSSSVRYLNKAFPLTRGEEIYFSTEAVKSTTANASQNGVAETDNRTSIMNKAAGKSEAKKRRQKPMITGRIMTGGYVNMSESRWSTLDSSWNKRTYLSPFMNFIFRASRLPSNLEVNVNMRWSYRYMNHQNLSPASLFSIYQLQISKHWDKVPFTLSVGRFYNRYEDFSGFWDGVMLRYGSYDNGIGVVTGFEPDESSSGFSSTVPKHSVFAYSNQPIGAIHSSTQVSFNALYPRNNWHNHMYFGIRQSFRYKSSSIGGSVQLDQKTTGNNWAITEGYFRAHIHLAGGLYADGTWRRSRPYRLWLVNDPFGFLLTQYGGGLSYQFPSGYLSGNILKEQGDWTSNALNYNFYSSYNLPYANIGINAHAGLRQDKSNKLLSFGGGIDRWFGPMQLSLQYEYYRTDYLNQQVLSHDVSAQINIPLFDKLYIDLQGRYEFGGVIRNKGGYIGIWYNF